MTEKLSSDGYPADFATVAEEGGDFCAKTRISELELECDARGKRLEDLREKLLSAEIGRRAALMGIPAERAGHIARLADLGPVFGGDGELDGDALGLAIDAVLADIPELRGGRAASGAFNPSGAVVTKSEALRKQISDANSKGDLLAAVSLKRKAKASGLTI